MKHLTVIGGFALNYKPLDFLNDLATVNYIDINQFPAIFNLEDMCTAIMPLLKNDNNLLIAYSMGGLLAIDLVYKNPDKFNQVILLNSTPYFIEDSNWLGISEKNFKKLQNKLEISNIDDFYKYFMTLVSYPELPTPYTIFKSNTNKNQLYNLLNILYKTDYRDKLSKLKDKFTLINAKNDVLIKNNFLDIKQYYLDNCSHLNISPTKEIIFNTLQLSFPSTTIPYEHRTILFKPQVEPNNNKDGINSSCNNQKLIQYNFNKAANTYLSNKNIQITAAEKIESYLINRSLHHDLILDLGSGPGTFKNNFNTILYDLSLNMLKTSKHVIKINGSATNLPFCNKAFSVIASNLMMQWITNKELAFKDIFRTLQDNGIFIYTTLIDKSLWQLTNAFGNIDNKQHTLNFITDNEYVKIAHNTGFKIIHSSIWSDTLLFNDIYSLLMHFKLTGTNMPKSNGNNGLGGRKNIDLLQDVYPKTTSQYPLTYKHLLMVLQK